MKFLGTLILSSMFVVPAAAETVLSDTSWQRKDGPHVSQGVKSQISFEKAKDQEATDGEEEKVLFRAFTGCNRMMGNATFAGKTGGLSFGPVASTKIACGNPAGEAEQELGEALDKVRRFSVQNEHLYLLTEDGYVVAVFGQLAEDGTVSGTPFPQ